MLKKKINEVLKVIYFDVSVHLAAAVEVGQSLQGFPAHQSYLVLSQRTRN